MSMCVVRAPRESEADTIAELHLHTWRETYGGVFPETAWGEEARTQRRAMWRAMCSQPKPDLRLAVAERDGEIVGFAGSGHAADEPEPAIRQLYFLYLLEAAQGSGAGQMLLDAVVANEPASLWVLESNARARAFYERNGFAADGARQPTGFDSCPDEIRMRR